MIIYERKQNGIEKERTVPTRTQAALNEQGCLTLREWVYGMEDENLIVFDQAETRSIFSLMQTIGSLAKTDLPF